MSAFSFWPLARRRFSIPVRVLAHPHLLGLARTMKEKSHEREICLEIDDAMKERLNCYCR
jgi:hypothetical protein